MNPNQIRTAGGTLHLPEAARRLGSLTQLHYADIFTLSIPTDCPNASAEEWARALFGDTPNFRQRLIFHGLLGLQLQRERSPATVAGWRIGGWDEEWVRLENSSWLLDGNLIVHKTATQVSLVTLLRYRSWVTHIWWPLLAFIHRRLGPRLFRAAEQKIVRGHGGDGLRKRTM